MNAMVQMATILTARHKAPPKDSRVRGPRKYNREGRQLGSGKKDKPLLARFDRWRVGKSFTKRELMEGYDSSVSHCGYVIERLKALFAVEEMPATGQRLYGAAQAKQYRKVGERPGRGS